MYCKFCGNLIDDDSVFCQFCGQKILQSSEPITEPPADPQSVCADNLRAEPAAEKNAPESPDKVNRSFSGSDSLIPDTEAGKAFKAQARYNPPMKWHNAFTRYLIPLGILLTIGSTLGPVADSLESTGATLSDLLFGPGAIYFWIIFIPMATHCALLFFARHYMLQMNRKGLYFLFSVPIVNLLFNFCTLILLNPDGIADFISVAVSNGIFLCINLPYYYKRRHLFSKNDKPPIGATIQMPNLEDTTKQKKRLPRSTVIVSVCAVAVIVVFSVITVQQNNQIAQLQQTNDTLEEKNTQLTNITDEADQQSDQQSYSDSTKTATQKRLERQLKRILARVNSD